MTGSLKRVVYDISPDNSGQNYFLTVDESNHEGMLVPGGAHMSAGGESNYDLTGANIATTQLPLMRDGRDFKKRLATYESATGQKKDIPICSQAIENDLLLKDTANINLNITDPDTGVVYALTRVRGQQIAIPKEFDTGLTDGDPT